MPIKWTDRRKTYSAVGFKCDAAMRKRNILCAVRVSKCTNKWQIKWSWVRAWEFPYTFIDKQSSWLYKILVQHKWLMLTELTESCSSIENIKYLIMSNFDWRMQNENWRLNDEGQRMRSERLKIPEKWKLLKDSKKNCSEYRSWKFETTFS